MRRSARELPTGRTKRHVSLLGNDKHPYALSIMGMKNDETDVQTQVVSIFYFREAKQLERWPYPEDSVARE
jgi:hypothetical protein